MDFKELINKASDLPCFTIGFLTAGQRTEHVRPAVNRWVKNGKVVRLHKGLYALAEPYRKTPLEPFVIANELKSPSYISLQSALAYHGMIPEYVPQVTSITTARPCTIHTPVGTFVFRHINKKYFHGFTQNALPARQRFFIASPEKALLDLIYLTPQSDNAAYLQQLRLQNLNNIDLKTLAKMADRMNSPKLKRACHIIETMMADDEGVYL